MSEDEYEEMNVEVIRVDENKDSEADMKKSSCEEEG